LLHNPSISFQAWDFYGIHRGFENWVPLNPFNPSVWLRQTWSEGDREREREIYSSFIVSSSVLRFINIWNATTGDIFGYNSPKKSCIFC
jgi:hypothetical protein